MTVLSDIGLRALYPHYRGAANPASINLAIGDRLLIWPSTELRDPRTDQSHLWKPVALRDIDGPVWVLRPHFRYLATTGMPISIPNDHAGQIGARSSWGRDGLAVICGPAGWCDPGYHGRPTLELSVIGSELVLWPGASIAQLILFSLDQACEQGYRGRYQGDTEATPSRLYLDGGAS